MGKLSSLAWELVFMVILVAVGLLAIYKLGESAGSGTPAANWSTAAAAEFTGNVSLVGLIFVIGLIGAVIGYVRFFKGK